MPETSNYQEKLERSINTIHHLKRLLELAQEGVITEELQKAGIEMIVRATNSEGGYLHFYDERENAIDLATWSASVMKTCEADPVMHYPIEMAGIWADCARERRPVIHNDYQSIE
ncbi:MAG: GAF domain-containing protein, partial [Sedimenticola sp.]